MVRSIRILHVDDEEDYLILFKKWSKRYHDSLIIDSVNSGFEALKKLNMEKYDVIISDYLMPDMNGLELLEFVKKSVSNDNPSFIILTGRGREEVVIQALNLGVDYYVQKIFDWESLVTELLHFIYLSVKKKELLLNLQHTTSLYNQLFSSSHIMHALLDPSFNFIRVNQAYAEADGKKPDYFVGKNHFDLFPNIENQKIFQQVVNEAKPAYYSAKPFEYEKNPERGVSYWDWSLVPIQTEDGKVSALLLNVINVNDRIKANELQKQIKK